jgi:hypothetical protein
MSDKQELRTLISSLNPQALFAEGFDKALIGMSYQSDCAVYCVEDCIEILVEEGMSEEDAIDHLYYNVLGKHVGEYTPIWMQRFRFT